MGLGNPGKQYQNTRHNAGYMALATLAKERNFVDPSRCGRNLITKGRIEGQKVILAWPQTYMNNSGLAARELLNYYKEPNSNLLVIHDDMDIPVGQLKASTGGGSGGHNGLISIINEIEGDFDRLRIGIGRPSRVIFGGDYAPYVLSSFTESEVKAIDQALELAAQATALWSFKGIAACQRKANVKPKPPKATASLKGQGVLQGGQDLAAPGTAEPVAEE
jgi:PTH1 family peptidyl-tRNA hydrolase